MDADFAERLENERLMPFKTLEERFERYKRECDQRVMDEVKSEVTRIREIEISKIRLDE